MFMTNATKLVENPVFRLKLILIVLAGINAFVFRRWISKSIEHWNINAGSPFAWQSFLLRFP